VTGGAPSHDADVMGPAAVGQLVSWAARAALMSSRRRGTLPCGAAVRKSSA